MRHEITQPLLAILPLLPLSVSGGDEARLLTDEEARAALEGLWQGELDGKALICRNTEVTTPLAVEFDRTQVIHYQIRPNGTKAVIDTVKNDNRASYSGSTYTVRPRTVNWWNTYTLNRETLALKYREITRGNVYEADYQCELADSPEAMLKTIEAARLEMQKQIDEEMSNNKI